jgi:micrococcal nuclease
MPFRISKKQLHLLISIIFIISAYVWQSNQPETTTEVVNSPITTSSQSQVAGDKVNTLDQNESISTINNPSPAPQPDDQNTPLYQVTKVIDGDTLEIDYQGHLEKVRLIGVNTPETVDPRRAVQCFGQAASDFSKAVLTNQLIRLEFDSSQDERDKYGRLLAYVYLSDGRLFNLELIAQGYAYEYTYKKPYLHQADFKAAQAEAQAKQLGLWSPANCPTKNKP